MHFRFAIRIQGPWMPGCWQCDGRFEAQISLDQAIPKLTYLECQSACTSCQLSRIYYDVLFDFIDLLVFFTFLNACTFFIFSFRFIAYFMRFIPSGFLPCVSHSMNIRKVFTSQRQQVMRLQLQQKLFQVPSFILVGLYNQAVGM